MPSAAAMARSSGVVMKPRTRSALAPTYVVRTVTDALSSLGYCLTLSDRIAWKPAMTITRLTTIARTGRRTKMSVNFMIALPIVRVRRELRVDLDLVVHGDGRPVSKLEGARADDVLPGRDAVDDRHEVAPGGADAHELLPRHLRGLVAGRRASGSGRVFLVFDDEDRVAVGRVDERRGRYGHETPLVWKHDGNVGEHPRTERLFLVGDRGSNPDRPRRGVDRRVDCRDRPVAGGHVGAFDGHPDRHANLDLGEALLRQGEVDVDGVDGLEHRDARARVQVLAEVDLADPEAPAERRANDLAIDLGRERVRVGGRRLQQRLVVVGLRLRDRVALDEGARSLHRQGREVHLGPRRGELSPLDAGVEVDQSLALPDHRARLEVDVRDDPGRVVAQDDALGRRDATDRGERALPGLRLRGRRPEIGRAH